MTGRLVEKKGFAEGVAAFAEARRSRDDARLLILGSGPEEERLRLVTRSLGLEDAVEFVPPLPRERFRDFMRSCHVVLQPSRTASDGDAEGGAPTTLLEAQALGRVIVATDHADIPNIVDRETAFLAPEGDADALADRLTTGVWLLPRSGACVVLPDAASSKPTTASGTSPASSSGSTIES